MAGGGEGELARRHRVGGVELDAGRIEHLGRGKGKQGALLPILIAVGGRRTSCNLHLGRKGWDQSMEHKFICVGGLPEAAAKQ